MAITQAVDAVQLGKSKCALAVTPELTTGFLNWRDRDSHFIFGDAAVAVIVEPLARRQARRLRGPVDQVDGPLLLQHPQQRRLPRPLRSRRPAHDADKLFYQQGRRVFKDVVPMAAKFIAEHLAAAGVAPTTVSRYWLHQANRNMNDLIAQRLLGREATTLEAPLILEEYANTASAGSVIAFSKYNDDLPAGAYGLMASFGAGYSLGSLLLRRV